jgi:hypothetical protein
MKKLLVLAILLCVVTLVCIKPDRDNEYDPNNPLKAYLEGKVHGFEGEPVENARIVLSSDLDSLEEYTDHEGWYEFDEVDPGIYTIFAEGGYYGPCEYYAESLAADAEEIFDIQFETAFWDFEYEELNTQEPHGFRALVGTWAVIDDPAQGYVYNGITPGTGLAIATTDVGANDFYYEAMFKVDPVSGTGFYSGLLFRFQDDHNFYLVFCSSSNMALIECYAGTWTTIDSTARSFALDTWYPLAVDCSGGHIQVFVNNESSPTFDITRNTFPGGRFGLFAEHNTTVSFDDIYIDISK